MREYFWDKRGYKNTEGFLAAEVSDAWDTSDSDQQMESGWRIEKQVYIMHGKTSLKA